TPPITATAATPGIATTAGIATAAGIVRPIAAATGDIAALLVAKILVAKILAANVLVRTPVATAASGGAGVPWRSVAAVAAAIARARRWGLAAEHVVIE